MKTCSLIDQCVTHPSGLRTMLNTHPGVSTRLRHVISLPVACCPISRNPREGSTLSLSYEANASILEVYALRTLLSRFVGGFPGVPGHYPAERNMEGMVQIVARMCADALGVPVRAIARLNLDTGQQVVRCLAVASKANGEVTPL